MVTTLTRKAWNDLSRRKARTVLTMVTVALAVGSMGLFFVAPMMDGAMMEAVAEARLHNVRIILVNASLDGQDMQSIEKIADIRGAEAHILLITRAYVGARACEAVVVGVDCFSDQQVDIVSLSEGRAPGAGEALTDWFNPKYTAFDGKQGDAITVLDAAGRNSTLQITGTGQSLEFSVYSQWLGVVIYTTSETARSLAGPSALTFLDIDLESDGDRDVATALDAVQASLNATEPGAAMRSSPTVVKDENWPGKDGFNSMMMGFTIITYLAILTSVVLISNTMNTTILEHTREIGCLKAVGATRLQVARVYITIAVLIGAIGSAVGVIVGAVIGNWLCWSLGPVFGIIPGPLIYFPGIAISLAAGIGLSVAASLPALWRAIRLNTREALDEQRISYKGSGKLMKAITGSERIPRTVQMGSRNIGRSSGRSIATVLQLGLAVATLLTVASIGSSVQGAISSAFDDLDYDIEVSTQGGLGSMEPDAARLIASVAGVKRVEPFTCSQFKVNGLSVLVMGLLQHSGSTRMRMAEGRWFTEEEAGNASRCMVVSMTLANIKGISLGDEVKAETPGGAVDFRVVGVADTILQMGQVVFLPISTLQSVLGLGPNVSGFYVKAASGDHRVIDDTASAIEGSLAESGRLVHCEVMYILERKNISGFMDIMNMIQGLGFIIVLISMVGLVNNLTMNVLERTREIGIMRCIGARARNIRAVFSSEGAVLLMAGWAVGVPLGYLLGFGLFEMFQGSVGVQMPFIFPAVFVLMALAVVIGIGALAIQLPISRAVRIPPGDALRYQ
jgi:putative ABC transport system permease protein